MQATTPYIRTQTDLRAELAALTRDGLTETTDRWSLAETYRALNQALDRWAGRVKVLYKYTLPNGFAAGTKEYTLPAYIRPPIYPEVYVPSPYVEHAVNTYTYEWLPVKGWDFHPDGAGENTLTVYQPRSELGQVWFYAPNSRVPITLPTLSAGISDTDTSLTVVSTTPAVEEVGIVRIGTEYIGYAGIGVGASTDTLLNLTRGLYSTTPASHNISSSVNWCVAVDTPVLFSQLLYQTLANLAAIPQFDGSTHERSIYQQLMNYYQQLANEVWAQYTPARINPPIRLNRAVYALR